VKLTRDGVYVGAVFGTPLLIHNSVFGAAPAIAFFAIWAGSTRDLAINLAVFPLLVASVVAHELAHARMAAAVGMPVRHIALTWFGGFAEFWTPPTRPWREAVVAFSGPAANLMLAAIGFLLVGVLFAPPPDPLIDGGDIYWRWRNPQYQEPAFREVLSRVAWFNFALGLFNLLPGLPLDGGHMLRAFLQVRVSRGRASWIACWAGVLVGAGTVVAAFIYENVWTLLIGAFVILSAWLEKRRLRYD
jgi:Zn-dependent protease